jgi:hypothetical protein
MPPGKRNNVRLAPAGFDPERWMKSAIALWNIRICSLSRVAA